jgi:hypothetical protein
LETNGDRFSDEVKSGRKTRRKDAQGHDKSIYQEDYGESEASILPKNKRSAERGNGRRQVQVVLAVWLELKQGRSMFCT